MEQKKEIKLTTYSLNTSTEYSIQELNRACSENWNNALERFFVDAKILGYELVRFTIESTSEGDYYGGSYTEFTQHIYRTESDKEFADRIEKNQKESERKELERLANKAKEFTKKKTLEKLMKDPDYKKFLELKNKFNLK